MNEQQRVRTRGAHRIFCVLYVLVVLALSIWRLFSSGGLDALPAQLQAADGAFGKIMAFFLNISVLNMLKMWVSFLFLLIPPVLCWLFRAKTSYRMNIAIYAFGFTAFSLGVAMEWYHLIEVYDLIAHFLSGVFFALVGMCAYLYFRRDKSAPLGADPWLAAVFSFSFSGFVAGFWELLEYAMFLITGYDSQNVAATGVADTMEDMFMGTLGGLLVAVILLIWLRKQYRTVLLSPVKEFYYVNYAPDNEGASAP